MPERYVSDMEANTGDPGEELRRRGRTNEVAYNIKRLMRGDDIGKETAKKCMKLMLYKEIDAIDTNFGGFFAAMTAKGPTKEEIVGCTEAVLETDAFDLNQITLDTEEPVYSICGCGKTDFKIFNVSTTAAFLAASTDLTIVKQGSYGTSKSTGAADAVELLGARPECEEARMLESAETDSIGFFTIGDKVQKYDGIYGGNFYFYHPLSFGFSALINRVALDGVVYGTMCRDTELVASVLQEFGFDNTMVVNSEMAPDRYMDELSVFGESKYSLIRDGRIETTRRDFSEFTDADDLASIRSQNAEENARSMVRILLGEEDGAKTDMACLNAGALLYAADQVSSIDDGVAVAREQAASGEGYERLASLVQNSGGNRADLERYTPDGVHD